MNPNNGNTLKNIKVDIKIRLSALWLAYMLLYIYTDFYKLYVPEKLQEIMSGVMDGIDVTQMSLLSVAIITIIPACMMFLTLILKYKVNRLLNIIVGILHIIIGVVNIIGATWLFYIFYGVLLIIVAILIVLYAWKWSAEIEADGI